MNTFNDSTVDKLNGFCFLACVLLIGFWSYPAKSDTTGIIPDYQQITSKDYIFKASIPEYDKDNESLECLADNLYHEARSDGYAGMYAVAMVTLNRVMDPRYPDKVCDVVKQGPVRESWKTIKIESMAEEDRIYFPVKHRCQFSWYCDGKADKVYDEEAYLNSVDIANLVLSASTGKFMLVDITEGSTHYHANYVSPKWRHDRGMMYVSRVGDHLFYRWELL